MEIFENYPITHLNTFHIQVDGRYFVRVASLEEIRDALRFASDRKIPVFVLGGGSNVLFTENFPGLIMKVDIRGIEVVAENPVSVSLKVGAGETWDDLVAYTVEQGWGGLENLSLIPGSVGASPIQNIGAYGVEMKDHFESLEYYDIRHDTIRTAAPEECQFDYRNSIFKQELKNQSIILSVCFNLLREPLFKTGYGVIREELERQGTGSLSLKTMRNTVIQIRESKLPDPNVLGNAGSFFKNPVVGKEDHDRILAGYPDLVSFKMADNTFKLAAGWLIDRCGWKGYREGAVGVHEKQALVLVNYGGGTGREVLALSEKISNSVKQKFGVVLEREVNVVPPPETNQNPRLSS